MSVSAAFRVRVETDFRFYFNKDRLVLGTNRPGDHWYCMPAARVAATMDEDPHALPRQPDEGAFYEGRDDVAYTKDGTILVGQAVCDHQVASTDAHM
jgi:hypothetical protein